MCAIQKNKNIFPTHYDIIINFAQHAHGICKLSEKFSSSSEYRVENK